MGRGRQEVVVPTYEDKVEAIYDYWKFLDLISFHGGADAFGECHRELIHWSQHHGSKRELILMPRGHLKSTLKTVGETLHDIYQNPNIRIFVGTATKPLATAFVREIRTYLEDEWLQATVWNDRPHIPGNLIPERDRVRRNRDTESRDRKVVWSTQAIQVIRPDILKEPTVTVGSVGSAPTGFHYDRLMLDDVVTWDNINTDDKRTRLYNWINDLICVLDPVYHDHDLEEILVDCGVPPEYAEIISDVGAKITAVGTRYDRKDWYNDIIENKEVNGYAVYQRNIYKNGTDSTDGYLWHERWNTELEDNRRANMTQTAFASQYLNRIIDMGSCILNMDKMHFLFMPDIIKNDDGTVTVHSKHLDEGFTKIRPIAVLDPAASVGEKSDFTSIVIGGKDSTGRLIVIDYRLGKWWGDEILSNLYSLLDKWRLKAVHVESVGGFTHFTEYVKANFWRYYPIALYQFKPTAAQGNKQVRITNALEPLIENGMFYITSKMRSDNEATDQIVFFPRDTVHDDFPDTLAALAELSKSPGTKAVSHLRAYRNKVYGGYR